MEVEPIPASALVGIETERRNLIRRLGPCRSGCKQLDDSVLLTGGFERGCVVGISAEDEDAIGVGLGLQVLACALFDGAVERALIVTPRPINAILVQLQHCIKSELETKGIKEDAQQTTKARELLNKVMVSCVFDLDGLYEALSELDAKESAPQGTSSIARDTSTSPKAMGSLPLSRDHSPLQAMGDALEIQDSQDEGCSLSPLPLGGGMPGSINQDSPLGGRTAIMGIDNKMNEEEENPKATTRDTSPGIIIITHFSSLLTSLFAQREKSAAHSALHRLSLRLRQLSRTLSSNPLILLLNSTDSTAALKADSYSNQGPANSSSATYPTSDNGPSIDPTLRSIFNHTVPPSPMAGAHSSDFKSAGQHIHKVNKPSFGLAFTQLLDMHLLCTRFPSRGIDGTSRFVTAIEVLLDELGLWEGKRGPRKSREQRWAAVTVQSNQVITDILIEGEVSNASARQ